MSPIQTTIEFALQHKELRSEQLNYPSSVKVNEAKVDLARIGG